MTAPIVKIKSLPLYEYGAFFKNLKSLTIMTLWVITVLMFFTACADAAIKDQDIRILAFGDSLTAGYKLPKDKGFAPQLQAAMQAKGLPATVINAGVSGDTTAGGLNRLNWVLDQHENIDLVILELGANDALRAIKPKVTRNNLEEMIKILKSKNIPVLLAGMKSPRNLGTFFSGPFDKIYPDLAEQYDLVLYPFFLDGIIMDSNLNLDDGMHPNEKGVGVIVEGILPYVEDALRKAEEN